jgi:NitT/TauT family transport system permease protein
VGVPSAARGAGIDQGGTRMTVAEQTAAADQDIASASQRASSSQGWRSRILHVWLPRILGYVLVLAVWQFASGRLVDAFTLPPPTTMLAEVWEIIDTGQFWRHFGATLRKIAVGTSLAFVVGLTIGVLMAKPWADSFFRHSVVSFLNTPGLVFVLVATMIFGFNPLGPITAIVVTSFPFVTVNIAEGVKAIPKDLLDMSRAFKVTEVRRLRHVVIPFLAPYTFAALRYGFSIAWKIATLTELFGSSSGIGFMIRREFELFSMAGLLAWIFLFCAFALLLEALLQYGMRRYFRWRPEVVI